ncbi:isoprenoid synthase domain-containing protein [Aspergillus coremiiformis]|uniref:Terpene synthase n=1 Tax=Aspergillus coremiiformis TaxID=138285 RepID=A0A5N6ZBK3_9EURO|nr:isoprenoid synthase domain-containing protein [Aspergillus coremiiformis]
MEITQVPEQSKFRYGKVACRETHVSVRIPNMFVLSFSEKPVSNTCYETVKEDSEAWISKVCKFDDIGRRKLSQVDFSYLGSRMTPNALLSELRTVCDWGNWVFVFDDLFDNGHLKDDPIQAQQLINSVIAGMEDGGIVPDDSEEHPLVRVHNSVWHRLSKDSPVGVGRRFADSIKEYCNGISEQVHQFSRGENPTFEETFAVRRQSVAIRPLFVLVEYAHKLNIPDSVFETRSIKELERIGTELCLLQNDIASYCKEAEDGEVHNVVAACRRAGMSAQMAFDHIGDMVLSRYREWHLALADLPSWSEDIDSEVQKYIRGMHNVLEAILAWSFHCERYGLGEEVRKSGIVSVPRWSADVEL